MIRLREDNGLVNLGINGRRRRGSRNLALVLIFKKTMITNTIAVAAMPDWDLVKMMAVKTKIDKKL